MIVDGAIREREEIMHCNKITYPPFARWRYTEF